MLAYGLANNCHQHSLFCKSASLCNNSLVGGGGTCAVVGEIRAGSLVFRSTCFVTGSVSIALLFITWEIKTGMYSYPFSCFTFFNVPLPGSWIVFARYNFVTKLRFFLWEVYMEIPVYSCELPSCFVSLITKI